MRVRSNIPLFVLIVAVALMLSGCLGGGGQPAPTQASDLEYTQAAETIIAQLTQSVPQTSAVDVEALASLTPNAEVLPATSTLEPSETLPPTSTPLPTNTPLPSDTPTPADTATPTFTATPAWNLVYQDDLKSGFWVTEKSDSFRLQYAYGGYQITSQIEKDITYSVRNDAYGNVRVDVTAQRIEGPLDGYYGIICGFINGGNYYFLGVGFDGWYGIGLKQAGQIRWLDEGLDQSGAVRLGNDANQLRAECASGQLTLWANGIQLASVTDRTFAAGQVGIGVGNREATGSSVVFKDFMVYEKLPQP